MSEQERRDELDRRRKLSIERLNRATDRPWTYEAQAEKDDETQIRTWILNYGSAWVLAAIQRDWEASTGASVARTVHPQRISPYNESTAPTCGTCQFSNGFQIDHTAVGICRRHAPRMEDRQAVWPWIHIGDWCGEHQPRTTSCSKPSQESR